MIDQAQREAFDRDGYFIHPGFFSPNEVEACNQELTAIARAWPDIPQDLLHLEPAVQRGEFQPEDFEMGVRKLFRMTQHSAYFLRLALHDHFVWTATSLLGPDVKLLQSMMLIKPPQCGSEKSWHQDNAFFGLSPSRAVGFWVALDQSTTENGCMHVVPASHADGPVEHERTHDLVLPAGRIDPARVVPLPMAAGDALIFHPLLYHYTPANTTNRRRRALQMHYVDARCTASSGVWAEATVAGRAFKDGL